MSTYPADDRIVALRAYAAGQFGTRQTIERAGMRDYADLVIALAQADLPFPKPAMTPAHEARVARARDILQPRLRHGD
jgi:hypothetical protein